MLPTFFDAFHTSKDIQHTLKSQVQTSGKTDTASKINYHLHTDPIKQNRIPATDRSQQAGLLTTCCGMISRMLRWCWPISCRMETTAPTNGISTTGSTKPNTTGSTRYPSGCCFEVVKSRCLKMKQRLCFQLNEKEGGFYRFGLKDQSAYACGSHTGLPGSRKTAYQVT